MMNKESIYSAKFKYNKTDTYIGNTVLISRMINKDVYEGCTVLNSRIIIKDIYIGYTVLISRIIKRILI